MKTRPTINNKNLVKNSFFVCLVFVGLSFAFSAHAGIWERFERLWFLEQRQQQHTTTTTGSTGSTTTPAAPSTPTSTCSVLNTGGGLVSVNSSCAFLGEVNGAENGKMDINAGATLTVGNLNYPDQTIVWNSGQEITITNGTIAIRANSASKLQEAYLWMVDVDGDGYPGRNAQEYSLQTISNSIVLGAGDSSVGSYRRRSGMINVSIIDCNDNDPSVNVSCAPERTVPTTTRFTTEPPPTTVPPTTGGPTTVPPTTGGPTTVPPTTGSTTQPPGTGTTASTGGEVDVLCYGVSCNSNYIETITQGTGNIIYEPETIVVDRCAGHPGESSCWLVEVTEVTETVTLGSGGIGTGSTGSTGATTRLTVPATTGATTGATTKPQSGVPL